MKALCLYFHMMLFVCQNFRKWNLVEICLWPHLAVKGLKQRQRARASSLKTYESSWQKRNECFKYFLLGYFAHCVLFGRGYSHDAWVNFLPECSSYCIHTITNSWKRRRSRLFAGPYRSLRNHYGFQTGWDSRPGMIPCYHVNSPFCYFQLNTLKRNWKSSHKYLHICLLPNKLLFTNFHFRKVFVVCTTYHSIFREPLQKDRGLVVLIALKAIWLPNMVGALVWLYRRFLLITTHHHKFLNFTLRSSNAFD